MATFTPVLMIATNSFDSFINISCMILKYFFSRFNELITIKYDVNAVRSMCLFYLIYFYLNIKQVGYKSKLK